MVPDHVFNPLIWAVPSVIGVSLIIRYTLANRPRATSATRSVQRRQA